MPQSLDTQAMCMVARDKARNLVASRASSEESGSRPIDIGALPGECDDGDAEEYLEAVGKESRECGVRRMW